MCLLIMLMNINKMLGFGLMIYVSSFLSSDHMYSKKLKMKMHPNVIVEYHISFILLGVLLILLVFYSLKEEFL